MRVDSGIGEVDGVAFALLQSSQTLLMKATLELVNQGKASRSRIDRAFRKYAINPALIREMSDNERFHKAIASLMRDWKPNQVFKFEVLKDVYLKQFKKGSKRITGFDMQLVQRKIPPNFCPRCNGFVIPTGEYRKISYSLAAKSKISTTRRARKDWRYETAFSCRKCRYVFWKLT